MAVDSNKMAHDIVECVGGADNVATIMHCMTRLRIVVQDESKVDLDALNKVSGVMKVVVAAGQYQMVIGTNVGDVYDAAIKDFNLSSKAGGSVDAAPDEVDETEANETASTKKNPLNMLVDTISGVFLPLLPAMGAVGMLKGVLVGLTSLGLLSEESDTYILLYALASAFFYYLPLALAISAADKFKANRFVSLAVVAGMIYPDIIPDFLTNTVYSLFGFIPVTMIDYTSTVIPAIVVVWFISKLTKLIKKFMPKVLDMVFTPLLTMIIAYPVALIVIGPITYYAGVYMADAYQWLFDLAPALAGGLLGLVWPILIVFGLHWGFVPIAVQQISTSGANTFDPITIGSNFATMGACTAVFVKSHDAEVKQVAGSAAISSILGGITEPGVYGVELKYKKPFVICCIVTAAVGVFMSFGNVAYPGIMTTSFITLPTLSLLDNGIYCLIGALAAFIGSFVLTYFFGYDDSMLTEEETASAKA